MENISLIAVSTGFASVDFVDRKLNDLLKKKSTIQVVDEFNGPAVTVLKNRALPYNLLTSPAKFSKSSIRKLLINIDYIIVFWDGVTLSDLILEAKFFNVPIRVIPVEVTRVMNRDKGDHYDFYIGRGTPWGNPYPLGGAEGQYSRDESIKLFHEHFVRNILTDDSKRNGLLGMRGYRIGCHCKPLACHGDVIATYLNSIDPDTIE